MTQKIIVLSNNKVYVMVHKGCDLKLTDADRKEIKRLFKRNKMMG